MGLVQGQNAQHLIVLAVEVDCTIVRWSEMEA